MPVFAAIHALTLLLVAVLASAATAAPPTAADLDGLQFEQRSQQVDNDASVGVCTGYYRWVSQGNVVIPYQPSQAGWSATSDPAPTRELGFGPQMLFILSGGVGAFEGIDSFVGVRDPSGEISTIRVSAPGPGGRCVNPRALDIGESYTGAATWSSDTPQSPDTGGPASILVQRVSADRFLETVALGAAPAPLPVPPAPMPSPAPVPTPMPMPAAPVVLCPDAGTTLDDVTLRKVDVNPLIGAKQLAIGYGNLHLPFRTQRVGGQSLCTLRSNEGALPVNLVVPTPLGSKHIHVADSVSTATRLPAGRRLARTRVRLQLLRRVPARHPLRHDVRA